MLSYINSTLRPLLAFNAASTAKTVNIAYLAPVSVITLIPINRASRLKNTSLSQFHKKTERVWVFTKNKNPNKLYVDNNGGVFLSPGIVLRFMNLDKKRFLKKRLRTWYGYIKALKLLQRRYFTLHFSDLYGNKSIFVNKLSKGGIRVSWLFIKLFRNDFSLKTKKSRRIKRWIKKKYYQLEVGEGR